MSLSRNTYISMPGTAANNLYFNTQELSERPLVRLPVTVEATERQAYTIAPARFWLFTAVFYSPPPER